jgi:hypothetical protein
MTPTLRYLNAIVAHLIARNGPLFLTWRVPLRPHDYVTMTGELYAARDFIYIEEHPNAFVCQGFHFERVDSNYSALEGWDGDQRICSYRLDICGGDALNDAADRHAVAVGAALTKHVENMLAHAFPEMCAPDSPENDPWQQGQLPPVGDDPMLRLWLAYIEARSAKPDAAPTAIPTWASTQEPTP